MPVTSTYQSFVVTIDDPSAARPHGYTLKAKDEREARLEAAKRAIRDDERLSLRKHSPEDVMRWGTAAVDDG